MEVSIVVGFLKSNFFYLESTFVDLSNFENLIFLKLYLTLSQSSHLWVKTFWQKFLSKIWIEHIPCRKNLGWSFYWKFGVIVIFGPQRWEFDFFFRPHKSKKGKRVLRGCKRVLNNFLKETWKLCLFGL